MTKTKIGNDGVSVVGLAAAACVACCAGPILAFLGALSLAGLASTWFIGGAGLTIAAGAAIAFLIVRRRRHQVGCAVTPDGPVPVEVSERALRP